MTRVESIITFAGTSVGGVERIAAKEEKQRAAIKIPIIRVNGCIILAPIRRPMIIGTMEMRIPKRKEASTSPKIIAATEMGADTSLSKVFILVSQGVITGTTEVAVKKRVMPIMLGTRNPVGTFLPIEKAKNRKSGNRSPKIRTGPLE